MHYAEGTAAGRRLTETRRAAMASWYLDRAADGKTRGLELLRPNLV
jgi:hypothetical protein